MMDWNKVMRMVRDGVELEHAIDLDSARSRASFRAGMLKWSESNPAAGIALEHYDAAMRDLDNGTMGARATWHSISDAQRRTLLIATKATRLERFLDRGDRYTAPGGFKKVCGVRTLRNLCDRGLLAWDGGAFDPEAAAVITEKGQFTVRHGPEIAAQQRSGR